MPTNPAYVPCSPLISRPHDRPRRARFQRLHPRDHRRGSGLGETPGHRDAFPPGTERLSPPWSRQIDLSELRHRPGVRGPLPPSIRRHESDEGGGEYVESIKTDIRWLGFDWGEHLYFASDYFEQLYDWAVYLIKEGKAYVDDQTAEEIRKTRGDLQTPGVESPWRGRPAEENLDLFTRMRAGEFKDGEKVLRAKIDMAHPNLNLRDPVLYRILHAEHHRTGDAWCIYPMYDYTHGQSDALEHVTHSLCTLEFEKPPRPLRLVPREPPRALAPPPDRVLAAQPHLHRDEQTQAPPARH